MCRQLARWRLVFIVIRLAFPWFASFWLLGWLVLPCARRVFTGLPDGGLAAGRVLALVLLSLVSFWGASCGLVPLTFSPFLLVCAPLALAAVTLRKSERRREFGTWMRAHRSALVVSDVVFALAFCGFLWLRMRHPELDDLEKPMDSALLGTLARASFLPAENPWLGGVPFSNYYYFGPLMASLPARLFDTPNAVAYNIAQPLWCAFFLSTLWSLCAALCADALRAHLASDDDINAASRKTARNGASRSSAPRRSSARSSSRSRPRAKREEDESAREERVSRASLMRGVAAMAIVGLLGHFETARQVLQTGHLWPLDWWTTARVIPDTINEYPFFTLAVGDLHAHFFALPINTLFLCLCYELLKRETATFSKRILSIFLGLMLGVVAMTNTWDVPILGALAIGVALLTAHTRRIPIASVHADDEGLRGKDSEGVFDDEAKGAARENRIAQWLWAFAPLPIAVATARPYLKGFHSPNQGVGRELWSPDGVSFFLLWGGLLALWTAFLWCQWKDASPSAQPSARHMSTHVAAILGIVGFSIAAWLGFSSLCAVLILCGATIRVWWARKQEAEQSAGREDPRFLPMLALAGALALLAPMCFYIRGAFGDGALRHQDTVFKFGLQAWLLLGIAASCSAMVWWNRAATGSKVMALMIFLPFALACSGCVVWARAFRDAPRDTNGNIALSLDGARRLPSEDRAAIEWLRLHALEHEAVLEAVGDDYSQFARVSALSGVATPLGWTQHVRGWGAPEKEIQTRWRATQTVFAWPDDAAALANLKTLSVHYIFVGALERRSYSIEGLRRLRAALPIVYQNGETFIARVP